SPSAAACCLRPLTEAGTGLTPLAPRTTTGPRLATGSALAYPDLAAARRPGWPWVTGRGPDDDGASTLDPAGCPRRRPISHASQDQQRHHLEPDPGGALPRHRRRPAPRRPVRTDAHLPARAGPGRPAPL